jgi:hypothetical protein
MAALRAAFSTSSPATTSIAIVGSGASAEAAKLSIRAIPPSASAVDHLVGEVIE